MIERYQLFLFPGVLALIAGALLSRGRLATRKKAPDLSGQPMKPDFTRTAAVKLFLYFMFSALFICGRLSAQTNAATNTSALIPTDILSSVAPNAKEINRGLKTFPTGREGASRAQGLYRRGAYRQSASAYLHAMSNGNQRLQNDCLFNAGCSFYRAGDYAGASESFNQIAGRENTDQSKVYYNLGCATYRLAEQSEKMGTNRPPELKPSLLEKAGNAFQRSLRANNDSPRRSLVRDGRSLGFQDAAANLAAVTNMLPKAREDAKMQTLMAKYGNQPPAQLADTMLENQRNIIKTLPAALTNAAPARISQFESLAEQQRANTDLLIPLKINLSSAFAQQGQAGQQQIPQLGQHLEGMQNSMNEAYESLRNIDNRSFHPVTAAERGIYNLWKGLASFEKLLQEDIRRQTNTITMTTSSLAKPGEEIEAILPEQNEAHLLTGLFTNRFVQAVPPEGTGSRKLPGLPSAPMPDEETKTQTTNEAPQISAETRTNILFLAEQAVKTQTRASFFLAATNIEASLPEQRHSYDLLKEIEKLLPKDKNKQNDQKNKDQQKQQQDQKKDQDQKDQKRENQDNQQQQNQPPQQEQQPPPPQEQKKEQPPPAEQKDQKEMTPEQLRALLEKAMQREKDHREEKMRDEYIPPSPVERDW